MTSKCPQHRMQQVRRSDVEQELFLECFVFDWKLFYFLFFASTALVVVDVKLPRGLSSTDFFTTNYATGHYSEDKFKWNFAVEPMQNFTVLFQHYTPPECQKNKVLVDYTLGDKTSFTKEPTDIQPKNKQGDFSLTLTSCEAKKGTNVPGLSLDINVAVFRGGIPCKENHVDLVLCLK